MKAFDPNYKLLDEMYQDNYYPTFLVDKVKDELQKVIDLLESCLLYTFWLGGTALNKQFVAKWIATSIACHNMLRIK